MLPDPVFHGEISKDPVTETFSLVHEGSQRNGPLIWTSKGFKYYRKVRKTSLFTFISSVCIRLVKTLTWAMYPRLGNIAVFDLIMPKFFSTVTCVFYYHHGIFFFFWEGYQIKHLKTWLTMFLVLLYILSIH